MSKVDKIREHLDSCKRCASEPFDLCPIGQTLLLGCIDRSIVIKSTQELMDIFEHAFSNSEKSRKEARTSELVMMELIDACQEFSEVLRDQASLLYKRADGVQDSIQKWAAGNNKDLEKDVESVQALRAETQISHMREHELYVKIKRLEAEYAILGGK